MRGPGREGRGAAPYRTVGQRIRMLGRERVDMAFALAAAASNLGHGPGLLGEPEVA